MKTKIDEIYSEIKSRINCGVLLFTEAPIENYQILDKNIQTINIAKCDLKDLEKEYSNASIYLAYLLQSEKGIPFGICNEFKIWYSLRGCQMRCGKEQRNVQIRCNGSLNNCVNH